MRSVFHSSVLKSNDGFSLIEILISTFLITLAITAFLNPLILTMRGAVERHDQSIALELVKDLLEEVRGKRFEDSFEPEGSFGREEEGVGYRGAFDDVDDYDDLFEIPPLTREGMAMDGEGGRPDYSLFRRKVTVENVNPRDYGTVYPDGSTDAKRITVEVYWFLNPVDTLTSRRVIRLYTVRSKH